MELTNIYQDFGFNENKPMVKVLFETSFTKEIRITMKKGQEMKEHKTSFPIVVELLEGEIVFGVEKQNHTIKKGGILALGSNIPHNLIASEDSTIRLTLSKSDSCDRVENVVNHS